MAVVQGGYGQTYYGGGAGVGARLAGNAQSSERHRHRVQAEHLRLQERSLDLQETSQFLQQQNADRASLLALAQEDRQGQQFSQNHALQSEQHLLNLKQFDRQVAADQFNAAYKEKDLEQSRTLALAELEAKAKQAVAKGANVFDKARVEANKLAEQRAAPGSPYSYTTVTGQTITMTRPFEYSPEDTAQMRDIRGQLGSFQTQAANIDRDLDRLQKEDAEVRSMVLPSGPTASQQERVKQIQTQRETLRTKRAEIDQQRWGAEVRLGMARTAGKGDEQLRAVIAQAPGLPSALAALEKRQIPTGLQAAYQQALAALGATDPNLQVKGVQGLFKLLQMTER